MIEKFEVGHWYRYTGKERRNSWNPDGDMDFVLDGLPHQCLEAFVRFGTHPCAKFKDSNPMRSWRDGFELWEEVFAPEALKESVKEILE